MLTSRRSLQRFDITIALEFKQLRDQSDYFYGITRNYSYDGFCIETQCLAFEQGDSVEIRVKHPQSELVVTAPGEVSWKKKSDKFACLMGIKLNETDIENKLKILGIMSATGDIPIDSFLIGDKKGDEADDKSWQNLESQMSIEKDEESKPETLSDDYEHINVEDQESNDLFNLEDTNLTAQEREKALHEEPATPSVNETAGNFKDQENNNLLNREDTDIMDQEPGIPADEVNSSSEKTDAFDPKISVYYKETESDINEESGKTLQEGIDSTHGESDPPIKESRKDKNWIYVLLAIGSIALLSYMVPLLFENPNNDTITPLPVSEKSAPRQETNDGGTKSAVSNNRSDESASQEVSQPEIPQLSKEPDVNKVEADVAENKNTLSGNVVTKGEKEYYIQVGAWRNPEYAREMLSKLKKYYPDARIIKEDNFSKVRITGIKSRAAGNTIVKNIKTKFGVTPLLISK